MDSSNKNQQRLPGALYALGMGGIGIGLTEFAIAGILPNISTDLNITSAKASQLVSGYAIAVAIGGVFLTSLLAKRNRKISLMFIMAFFVLGNLISAFSHTFQMLFIGRCISALAHGAFFGIGAVVAITIVDKSRRSTAISIMFGGLTVANVLGVPFGTWIGLHFGWRASLFLIAIVGIASLLGLYFTLSDEQLSVTEDKKYSLKQEFLVFKNRQIWYSLAFTIFGFGGMFGVYTYIVFILEDLTKFSPSSVPPLLLLFGIGVFIGNFFGGRFADRNLDRFLGLDFVALFSTLVLFGLFAHHKIETVVLLFLMGVFGFAPASGLQMRVLHYASDAPVVASGSNITSFNIGNALGAWMGGLFTLSTIGYLSSIWVGCAITFCSIVFFGLAQINLNRVSSFNNKSIN